MFFDQVRITYVKIYNQGKHKKLKNSNVAWIQIPFNFTIFDHEFDP